MQLLQSLRGITEADDGRKETTESRAGILLQNVVMFQICKLMRILNVYGQSLWTFMEINRLYLEIDSEDTLYIHDYMTEKVMHDFPDGSVNWGIMQVKLKPWMRVFKIGNMNFIATKFGIILSSESSLVFAQGTSGDPNVTRSLKFSMNTILNLIIITCIVYP